MPRKGEPRIKIHRDRPRVTDANRNSRKGRDGTQHGRTATGVRLTPVRNLINRPMSALGQKRTFSAITIYVRYWGVSGHSHLVRAYESTAQAVPPQNPNRRVRVLRASAKIQPHYAEKGGSDGEAIDNRTPAVARGEDLIDILKV